MSEFLNSIEEITLIYNIALLIVTLFFFTLLFRIKNKHAFTKPWKLLFLFAITLFIKQIINILRFYSILETNHYLGAFFDFFMAILLVYAFLIQGEKIRHR